MTWDSPKFAVGEVVALRSSTRGSSMTIEVVEEELIGCAWIDRTGKVRRDKFPRACLKKSSDADGHLIFMPSDNLNDAGIAAFMAGERNPVEAN